MSTGATAAVVWMLNLVVAVAVHKTLPAQLYRTTDADAGALCLDGSSGSLLFLSFFGFLTILKPQLQILTHSRRTYTLRHTFPPLRSCTRLFTFSLASSPGSFYLSPSPGGSKNWLIYYAGGGWCSLNVVWL